VFVVAAGVLIAIFLHGGDIRPNRVSHHRRRHR
jgi:hypothetical protein